MVYPKLQKESIQFVRMGLKNICGPEPDFSFCRSLLSICSFLVFGMLVPQSINKEVLFKTVFPNMFHWTFAENIRCHAIS